MSPGTLFPSVAGVLGALCIALLSSTSHAIGATEVSDSTRHCLVEDDLWLVQGAFAVKSLKRIYHGGYRTAEGVGNVLCMNGRVYARAQQRYETLTDSEHKLLIGRYCVVEIEESSGSETTFCEEELILWALRDPDGDGILDFRIKEFGSFIQNDPDADNDGIENLMDPEPLINRFAENSLKNNDFDDDTLPDHLDWSNTHWHSSFAQKSTALREAQERIFQNYGIVLIEAEGSEMAENFALMTEDVLSIFKHLYKKYDAKKNMRSITLSDQYGYDPSGVLAEVSPVNGQIRVFEYGTAQVVNDRNNLIAPFMIYIHEFSHVIQNAMDYPANSEDLLLYNAHTTARRFAQLLKTLGWSVSEPEQTSIQLSSGFVDHGEEPLVFDTAYRAKTLDELKPICKNGWNDIKLKTWKQFNLVTCYSLDSVREWHAEYITTTVLQKLYSYVADIYPRHSADMIRHSQSKMYHDWDGESYDYANADGSSIGKISRQLRMSNRLIRRIAERYVVNPYLHSFNLTAAEIGEVHSTNGR